MSDSDSRLDRDMLVNGNVLDKTRRYDWWWRKEQQGCIKRSRIGTPNLPEIRRRIYPALRIRWWSA